MSDKMVEENKIEIDNFNFLDLVIKAENIGYIVYNQNRRITHFSPEFAKIIGLSSEADIRGSLIEEVLTGLEFRGADEIKAVSLEDFPDLIAQFFNEKEGQRKTLFANTKDGRNVCINSWFEAGRMIATARDVSVEKQYRDLFEMAMEAAHAGIWSMSFETGKFSYSDSVLKRLTPSEVERMQEQGLWAIIHRSDVVQMTKSWQAIVAGTQPFNLVYRVVTELDGVMWQRSVGRLRRGSDGHLIGATAFVTDISKDVEKQEALIHEKEGSKAKSEFLARMSHEIRTPLNAIIGMSDSLKDEDLSEEVLEVIEDIEQAADGLHHLLSRTLDHAKLMSDKMQVDFIASDIREIVNRCVKLWRPQSSAKSIALNVDIDPSIPDNLLIDGFRLQQCLNNLLSNAVKFTDNGRIDLIVKSAMLGNRLRTVIAVKDTGIGMSALQVGSIFEPFSQADKTISRKYGGTGLGMSITKQLTELMGGQVKVNSQLSVGTTFVLILPVLETAEDIEKIRTENMHIENQHADADILEEAEESDDASKPFAGLSVLCVEDNPINQKVVKRLIGKRVQRLHFANNGREALDVLGRMHIDVVLMDIHMPVMDGIEATLEIRSSPQPWAKVIIIALTADPDYQQKKICRNIGMDDTISKPVRRQDILDAFDKNLNLINKDFSQDIKLTA